MSVSALAVGAIISAIISAVGAASAAGINYTNQQKTNAANINAQNAINKQAQYNIEHAHQIEMADLEAAGLNPVLTATGGQGVPMASLNAPRAQAPNVDLSGVSSALSSMVHMMMMQKLLDTKIEATNAITDAKISAAQINADSRLGVADKYINAGSRRSTILRNSSAGQALINSSKKIDKLEKELSNKGDDDLDDILEFFKGR